MREQIGTGSVAEEVWKNSALRPQRLRRLSADKTNYTGFSLKNRGGLALWWFYTTLTVSEKQFTTCVTICRNLVGTASPDFIFTSEMI